MTQIKQDRGIFHVEKHGEKPGENTVEIGIFKGTVYWSIDMGRIIDAEGCWEDAPEGLSVRDLSVDEKASGERIYCLFF